MQYDAFKTMVKAKLNRGDTLDTVIPYFVQEAIGKLENLCFDFQKASADLATVVDQGYVALPSDFITEQYKAVLDPDGCWLKKKHAHDIAALQVADGNKGTPYLYAIDGANLQLYYIVRLSLG